MIVFDTTVLVYGAGDEHPLRAPCRRLFTALRERRLTATTTAEVIQEFTHVRSRRRSRRDAVDLAIGYTDGLTPLLQVSETDLRAALQLYTEADRLGSFDAVLAAVTLASGAEALVTADRAFERIAGLRVVHPDDTGVDSLLG